MEGPQDARVRRAVVDEDRHVRRRKRPPDDLAQQHPGYGDPHRRAGLGRRGLRGARHEREIRREEVGEREANEGHPQAPDGSEARREGWVDEELKRYAKDAQDRHRRADLGGRKAQAAGEDERELATWPARGLVRVVDGRRQEHEPEAVERADVEGEAEARQQGDAHVACEDASER